MSDPKIQVLSDGNFRGKSFTLTAESYTVGRSDERDICVADSTVSGRHATIFKNQDGVYFLRDEGSTNGSRVNGDRVEPGVETPLHNGDIFQLGGVEFLYDAGEISAQPSRMTSVISLDNSSTGESTIERMSNMGTRVSLKVTNRYRANPKQRKIALIFFGILGLALLAAVGCMVYISFFSK